jgi:hypothetical protein
MLAQICTLHSPYKCLNNYPKIAEFVIFVNLLIYHLNLWWSNPLVPSWSSSCHFRGSPLRILSVNQKDPSSNSALNAFPVPGLDYIEIYMPGLLFHVQGLYKKSLLSFCLKRR